MVNSQGDTTKLIMGFVGIIIAVVILASASDSISIQTSTFESDNASITVGAVNSTTAITGRNLIGTTWTVYNESNDVLFGSNSNVTWFNITTQTINGVQTIAIFPGQNAASLVGDTVNVSYTYADTGYISDSGGRSVTNLIPIMAALAILVFSLMMIFSTNAGRAMLGIKN